ATVRGSQSSGIPVHGENLRGRSGAGWGTVPTVHRGAADSPGWFPLAPAGQVGDRQRPCRNEYRRPAAPAGPASRWPFRRVARARFVSVRWRGEESSSFWVKQLAGLQFVWSQNQGTILV